MFVYVLFVEAMKVLI